MKKSLLTTLIIILTVVFLGVIGYIFRFKFVSLYMKLNRVQLEGEVFTWEPQTGLLRTAVSINKQKVILDLSVDPKITFLTVLEDKEILQKAGENVYKPIESKEDPLFAVAFCTGDKLVISTTRSVLKNLKNTKSGLVDSIDNIGERNCFK